MSKKTNKIHQTLVRAIREAERAGVQVDLHSTLAIQVRYPSASKQAADKLEETLRQLNSSFVCEATKSGDTHRTRKWIL